MEITLLKASTLHTSPPDVNAAVWESELAHKMNETVFQRDH
jgi:hypothetical protein